MIIAATAKLDDIGKPAWIAVMVLGFVIWWPVGLAILGYMIWSGRMGCGRSHWGRWRDERWGNRSERGGRHWGERSSHSGNSAFEDYKADTLRRLEDEQKEFVDFLRRLRDAKDKAEFDEFMNERRNRPQTPPDASPETPATPTS